MHIFCPPIAVAIDGALATVGISGGIATIVVPVTAGGISLGSGALSGMLFHKCFVFPEASNDVKEQIQHQNQASLLAAMGNTENFQANEQDQSQQRSNENDKPSVLNNLIPGAKIRSNNSGQTTPLEQVNEANLQITSQELLLSNDQIK